MKKILFSFFIQTAAFCAAAQPSLKPMPVDPSIHTGKLANGFTYYIRKNSEPKNRVLLYLVNKVGSLQEDEDQRGLAHFMEHMNFNGTKHFPKNKLVDYLQRSGVKFGADLNAYTGFDETVYQLPLPTDSPVVLRNGFQIMRDWAQDATLDSIEIQNERGVVLEEKRMGRGAQERLSNQYYPMVFNHSRYAERMPIGTEAVISGAAPAVLRRFHHDWYRPDLQALIVVGDVDVAATEALIKSLFSDCKNPSNERARKVYTVPLAGKDQFMALTDKEEANTSMQVMMKQPVSHRITEKDYLDAIKRSLFNQMIAARFAELSTLPNPPFLGLGASMDGFMGNLDAFNFTVATKEGKLKESFMAGWEVLERIKRYGFTQAELDRAKTDYFHFFESANLEKDKVHSSVYVTQCQEMFTKGERIAGLAWETKFVNTYVPHITLGEINALTKAYIRDTDRDFLVIAPDKEKNNLPSFETIKGWIKEVAAKKIEKYADSANDQPLLKEMPKPGTILSETRLADSITSFKLSNGITVLVRPSNYKNDEIKFGGFAAGGISQYGDDRYMSATQVIRTIMSSGVGDLDVVQLGKKLTGKSVAANPYMGEHTRGLSGSSSVKDLELGLQLMYAYITRPRFDTVQFNNMIAGMREDLRNRGNIPQVVFGDTVGSVINGYHFRRLPISEARVGMISLDQIKEIYKDRFSDFSNFTFFFMGSVNIDSLKPLIEKYIASLPSLNRNEVVHDIDVHTPQGHLTRKVYKGKEPLAVVSMVSGGFYEWDEITNLKLKALGEILSIMVLEDLREKEGGIYSAHVSASYNKFPRGKYSFNIAFGCAPDKAEKLCDLVMKEFELLRTEGPSETNVQKFKAEFKRARELQLRDNGFWLGYLRDQLSNNGKLSSPTTYEKDLEAITVESLKAAAKLYMTGDNDLRFMLLPEETK